MTEVKRKLRNSKQADLADITEGEIARHLLPSRVTCLTSAAFHGPRPISAVSGPETKKRKSPAKPKASNKKTKQEDSASGAGLTQATVEDVSAAKASKTDAKLVDPNTGAEVHMSPGPDAKQTDSNKPKRAAKNSSNNKDAALVDPNTGSEVDAAATVQSKPAAKQGRKKQVKDEATADQADPMGSCCGRATGIQQGGRAHFWQGYQRHACSKQGQVMLHLILQHTLKPSRQTHASIALLRVLHT